MTTCPMRNPQLAWREIDGEIVIISPEDSQVHELNETAALVWKRADGGQTVEQIAGDIAARYDVTSESAQRDVAEFIVQLAEKQLLTAVVGGKA
jgi:Coenzyme PQQ synthesis protein D (PqqD)